MSGARFDAVLHAHSDWSYDGSWRLERIARLFGAIGARAVLMTEHDDTFSQDRLDEYRAACDAASSRRCRLVPGIEYSGPGNDVHILTWGVSRFLGSRRPVHEILDHVAAQGGVAVFAHPQRREVWRSFDPTWAPKLHGIEIWNRKSDGVAPFEEAIRLSETLGIAPTLGVDFHRLNQLYPLFCRVDGPGADPEAEAIAAIRARRLELIAAGGRIGAGGDLRRGTGRHQRAERLRRGLKRLLGR